MNMKEQIAAARDTVIKALTAPTPPPIIGLDLDGVIDENVWFFSFLTNSWPGDVFIITYRDDRKKAEADLGKYGIKYKELVLVNSFEEKAKVIDRLGIDVYFEDQDEIIRTISEKTTVLKMRNGGNYDAEQRKWLYSSVTGRLV